MLVSEKMAFIELHKGGSTRIQKMVSDLGGGEVPGKIPSFANELAALNKPVIGYLCDPLGWYLNQWKMGCAERGELYRRLTDRSKWSSLLAKRAAREKAGGGAPAAKAIPEGWGAERAKNVWYSKAEEPAAFREWLQAVLTLRALRRLVNPTFANSPLQRQCGLMTYEYFLTFVRDSENLDKSIDSPEKLKALNDEKAVTRLFIRAETPGADFLRIMGELGVSLTDGQQHTASAWDKDHEAFRELEFSNYYDDQSRRLVLKRERFICEQFGYQLAGAGAADGDHEDDDEAGDKPGKGKGKKAGKLGKPGKPGKGLGKKKGGKNKPAGEDGGDDDDDTDAKPKLSPEQRQEKREARQAAKAAQAQAGGSAAVASGKTPASPDDDDDDTDAPAPAAKKAGGGKGGGTKAGGKAAGKTTGKTGGKPAGKPAGKAAAGKSAGNAAGKSSGKAAGKSAEKSAAKKQSRTAAKKAAADQAGADAPADNGAPDSDTPAGDNSPS